MKHKNSYGIYTVDQDLIDFLRGDGENSNRSNSKIDKQIYTHYGLTKKYKDKYFGIIIDFQKGLYFAPVTHDGAKKWLNRDGKSCDFELIYDGFGKYAGALLLCKALPLTSNLVHYQSLKKIKESEGENYANLCSDEMEYLNSIKIHDKIQEKMQACIYGKESPYMNFRVNYSLVVENVKEYNELKQQELLLIKNKSNESG